MITSLITLLIYIIIIGLILWIILWVLGQIPLPEPFGQVARVLVVLVAALILIALLLDIAGTPLGLPRLR